MMGRGAAFSLLALFLVLGACSSDDGGVEEPTATVEVFAEGLINPIGLAALPDGRLLVAEEGTGERDNSAGVSIVETDGTIRRVVSGLPSSRDAGDLSGVPLVGVSPDGDTVYTAHFNSGALLTFPTPSAKTAATASPLGSEDLEPVMIPLNRVRLVNPFDITFDAAGVPVVTDATANGVAIENPDGTTRFFHRFGELSDPEQETLLIEPVPTGITRVDSEYYVTLTGGCPYPEGSGRLVAVDVERNERVVLDGLNMPIDVAVDGTGTVWVLEFARFEEGASCFTGSGYLPGTGRLSRIVDGERVTVIDELNYPGAVLPMPDGSLFVSEVFAGRILRITLEEAGSADVGTGPTTPIATSQRFQEVAAEVGIDFRHGAFATGLSDDPVAMMGAGLCWLDYDGDGWLDLYLVNSHSLDEVAYWEGQGGLPTNALFRNEGGAFQRVADSGAELAMRGNGCVAGDLDLDGDTDIYVTADGPNALLRNNGDGTFSDIAADAGVDAPEWSTAAAIGDITGDGLPDLYVGGYIDLEVKVENPIGAFPQDHPGIPDRLYLNQGGMGFTEVPAPGSGTDRTLGALIADYDEDGDFDLYVANDGNPNRMYLNDGTGRLTDVTAVAGVGDSGSGMGIAGGDYDGDGGLDLLVTNWDTELNALYRNELPDGGDLTFQYTTAWVGIAGLGSNKTGWGVTWSDFDNDTDLDMLIVHGRVPVTDLESDAELVRLYGNLLAEGKPGQFLEWTDQAGLREIGSFLARGSAVADFDNDGDLDVAINTIAGSARLLRNEGTTGNWLTVDIGFAPGAVVVVTLPDGRRLVRHAHAGSSYLASEDPRLHFGLGEFQRAQLEVTWPDGGTTRLADVAANAAVVIETGR